jgi:DNA invertase Pin-like site-specific DNA recombinase
VRCWPGRGDEVPAAIPGTVVASFLLSALDRSSPFLYRFLKETVQTETKALARKRNLVQAVGYLRTSSATNAGHDKDSEPRQRRAIERFAKSAGFEIVDWFNDPAVSGADPIESRPGFAALLNRIEGNGVRVVLVEDATRFARDLMAQELGIGVLIKLGMRVITATGDDLTVTDDHMKVAMRQIAGAFSQLEKARLVAKLKAARDKKIEAGEKCGGRKSYAERDPELVKLARQLYRPDPDRRPVSLRKVAGALAERGYVTPSGQPYSASSVASMIASEEA